MSVKTVQFIKLYIQLCKIIQHNLLLLSTGKTDLFGTQSSIYGRDFLRKG